MTIKISKNSFSVIDFDYQNNLLTMDTTSTAVYMLNEAIGLVVYNSSVKNHLGIEQSTRDDLESIGYTLLYF